MQKTTLIYILLSLIGFGFFSVVGYMLYRFISSQTRFRFMMKSGREINFFRDQKDFKKGKDSNNTFEFQDGKYRIDDSAKCYSSFIGIKNIPTYYYREGIVDPLNFNTVDTKGFRLDPSNFKKVLVAKLISDMLSQDFSVKDIMLIVIVIANLVVSLVILFTKGDAAPIATHTAAAGLI